MGEETDENRTKQRKQNPPATVPQITSMKKYVAELIGTMVLVLIGCGSAVMAGYYYIWNRIYLGIAFAFGLAVLNYGVRHRRRVRLPH